MGTLESIRGYVDKHPDATSDDWRVAQSQGWRKDGDRRPVTVTVPDNTEAVTRLTRPGGPAAPEGIREAQDKLIRVLLRVLTALNHDAGEKGVMWYVNRVEGDGSIGMTKTQASEWIDRIRAKIHEFAPDHKDGRCNTGGPCAHLAKAVVEIENTPYVKDTRAAWARWRELAAQLVELGGRGGARFAVDTEHGAINSVAFWRISAGRDGRFWVRQVIGGRGDVRVNFGPDTLVSLAEKIIAAGPRECMLRYGRELGWARVAGVVPSSPTTNHALPASVRNAGRSDMEHETMGDRLPVGPPLEWTLDNTDDQYRTELALFWSWVTDFTGEFPGGYDDLPDWCTELAAERLTNN